MRKRGVAYIVEPSERRGTFTSLQFGLDPREKVDIALDGLLGTKPEALTQALESDLFSERVRDRLRRTYSAHVLRSQGAPQLYAGSIREVYEVVAGDTAYMKVPPRGLTVRESQFQADWAYTLGAALNRKLLASYAEPSYGEHTLMRPVPTNNFRDQRVVGIDAPGDLPVIDPESQDWTDMSTLHDWEAAFSMAQRGAIISISRRVVLNNDVEAIQRFVDGLGRAARRTLARAVWSLWASNATYGADSKAWFHTDHANLQTTALAKAEVVAAISKLVAQTEPGSGEKLGARVQPGSLWLTVPPALWETAYGLNQEVGSSLFHLFGDNNEYVVVNPILSDASDWGVHRDVSEIESVRASFLNGREEPEIFLADTPGAGQMLLADKLQYKIRHEYGVGVAEYRGAVKAVVP
jgi:hypothetical protein